MIGCYNAINSSCLALHIVVGVFIRCKKRFIIKESLPVFRTFRLSDFPTFRLSLSYHPNIVSLIDIRIISIAQHQFINLFSSGKIQSDGFIPVPPTGN